MRNEEWWRTNDIAPPIYFFTLSAVVFVIEAKKIRSNSRKSVERDW